MKHGYFFEKLKGDSVLIKLINAVFKELDCYKIVSSPKYFNEETLSSSALMYYNLLLFENYINSLVERLSSLKEDILIYNNTFKGSWEYYASSKRVDSIKEYGDYDDFDEDGNAKPISSEDDLQGDTIINKYLGYNDIVLTMRKNNFNSILLYVQKSNEMSVFKMFENLKSYRNENGVMVENSFADQVLMEAREQHIAETNCNLLYSVICEVDSFLSDFESLKWNEDNKAFFSTAIERIDNIFDLKIELKEFEY